MEYEDYVKSIKVGQVWLPNDKDDYTIEILSVINGEVKFKQLENGEVWEEELDGNDGFVDFLYSNLYSLK